MARQKRKFYYTYALIDPRTALPFYVGKGSGPRLVRHFQNVPKSLEGEPGSAKYKKISSIKKAGLLPKATILGNYDDEDLALKAERQLIKSLGLAKLTNQNAGGGGHRTTKRGQGLTPKQEAFCHALASGKYSSNTQAYCSVYSTKRMAGKTIHEAVSRLLSNSKVATRIEELRRPAVQKTKVDLEYVINGQQRAAELADETGNAGAMSSAYKELGKLVDAYPAERKHLTVDADDLTVRIKAGRERARQK
jgi:hypothetical protein